MAVPHGHTTELLVGGELVAGAGEPLAVEDPYTTETVATVSSASAEQVEAAVGAGAEVLVGGGDGGQAQGHFLSPAVITGAAADSALLTEETFGPVAPLVPVDSLDEAIALANGTELGREGLEAFQETKHVHMESRIERKEWWYPYREYGGG